eukprot:TRINITY_DN21889_c0_g1_i2.p1 TRINITY_DN21889_c0_g1~~TRINITY_DN21889_c0_g1_i2.p1  ORF type:complete len:412 (-),score=84.53 TRINITY_DN21889_c0_g1_i2:72-1259(-)
MAKVSQEELRLYYERLFPAERMFQWLTAGNPASFPMREFSMTLPGDVYIRFNSFATAAELRQNLVKKLPEKLDIGGIYNHPPNRKDGVAVFQALEKELVFDVDASDYDDVRVCCQEKKICTQCWPLMVCAARVLDFALSEYFGLHHNAFVFSGRRGLHCWTCDRRARNLTDEERACITNFLHLYEGGERKKLKIDVQKRLPQIFESMLTRIVEPTFVSMFASDDNPENNLNQPKTNAGVLSLIESFLKSAPKIAEGVRKTLGNPKTTAGEKWSDLTAFLKKSPAHAWIPKYVMLAFAYPRLDVNVSKARAHLLKAPFVVHPGTGNICVAMPLEQVAKFDPAQCPTLQSTLQAYEKGDFDGGLQPVFAWFESFVSTVCESARGDCAECHEAEEAAS